MKCWEKRSPELKSRRKSPNSGEMMYVLDVFIKRTFLLCICILNKTRTVLSPFSVVILCSHVLFTQR